MDTSFIAYTHTIHAAPSGPDKTSPEKSSLTKTPEIARLLNLYGPLIWLFQILMSFTIGKEAPTPSQDVERRAFISHGNRETRRYFAQGLKPGKEDMYRRRALVTRILSRGLTPAQYREKVARIFPGGRVRTYGLRYWGSRRLRRAQLSCHDHGTWRRPHASAMNSGMWDVQLPPN